MVIATGYATRQFRPLAGRFRLVHTYVAATPPLDARARREIGLADVLLWDTRRPYHYARWTADHRLLLGGADRPIRGGPGPAARLSAAVAGIRAHFEPLLPALGDVAIAHAWEGRFANTPDSLPYIGPHRRYPGHAFALGYGGNGMTFGSLAGRLLVEQWQGVESKDHALFTFYSLARRLRSGTPTTPEWFPDDSGVVTDSVIRQRFRGDFATTPESFAGLRSGSRPLRSRRAAQSSRRSSGQVLTTRSASMPARRAWAMAISA